MTVTEDQGASVDRTRLAWRRTGLSAGVVGLLAARPAFDPAVGGLKWLVAVLALTGWAILMALSHRRGHGLTRQTPRPARRAVPAYALVTVAFAVLGGLVVIL